MNTLLNFIFLGLLLLGKLAITALAKQKNSPHRLQTTMYNWEPFLNQKLVYHLRDIRLGLGYGFDIFPSYYIFRFTAGATDVLTSHAAPFNLSHLHLLLERCHRFFFLAVIMPEN